MIQKQIKQKQKNNTQFYKHIYEDRALMKSHIHIKEDNSTMKGHKHTREDHSLMKGNIIMK